MKKQILLALITAGLALSAQAVPANLVWSPTDGNWNTTTANWTNIDTSVSATFAQGDNVLFNDIDNSGAVYSVDLGANLLSPNNVVVDSYNTYTIGSSTGGKLTNVFSLTKKNSATLILDADNVITNAITIEAGTLQIGSGAGRGALGTAPVSNDGTLVFNRTGTLNFYNNLSGSGKLTVSSTGTWNIRGTNTMSGYQIEHGGAIMYFTNSTSIGSPTSIQFNVSSSNQRFQLGGGVTVPDTCPITFTVPFGDLNTRASLMSVAGSNTINAPIYISGGSYSSSRPNVRLYGNTAAHQQVIVNSSVDDVPGDPFQGNFYLCGNSAAGINRMYGKITLSAAQLLKDEATTWYLHSTGNTATLTWVGGGRLNLAAANALPVAPLVVGETAAGILDLGGYNQTVGPLTGSSLGVITNSSTTADALLTLTNGGAYSGSLKDNASGRISLKLLNPGAPLTQQLLGDCSYRGATTLDIATAIALGNSGLPNSTPIEMGDGSSLDLSTKTGNTFTLGAAQTLKSGGNAHIKGNLINNGTLSFDVSKSGATVTATMITVDSPYSITYGGTLNLTISGDALASGDTIKLFDVTAPGVYQGVFGSIVPSIPGAGLAWNTNSLTVDGTLKIDAAIPTTGTNLDFTVVGGGTELEIAWPESYKGWTLQGQTNALNVGISTGWTDVAGSATTNRVYLPIDTANGSVFYRLYYVKP